MRRVLVLVGLTLAGCPASSVPDAAIDLDAGVGLSDAGGPVDAGAPFRWDGGCVPLGTDFCLVNPLPFPAQLNAIAARADDDVWLVGHAGLIAHWNGASLAVQSIEGARPANFFSVVAPRADCAWAAGGHAVAQWDGQRWRTLPPTPDFVDQIAVTDDCAHPLVLRRDSPTLHRWNGAAWEAALTVAQLSPPLNQFTVVSSADDRVWLAGYDAQRPRVFELTDAGFTDRTPASPDLFPIEQLLVSSRRVFAVTGFNYRLEEWTGSSWVGAELPSPNLIRRFALDENDQPLVLLPSQLATLDAGQLVPLAAPLYRPVLGGDLSLSAIDVSPGGQVWVGGEDGALARRVGASWTTFSEGPIWQRYSGARVGDELWVIGALGTTALSGGRVEWRNLTPPASACEYLTIASHGTEVMLGGYEFTSTRPILRWDGAQFVGETITGGQPRVQSLFRVANEWWGVVNFINVPGSSAVVARNASGVWRTVQSGGPGAFGRGWSDGQVVITIGSVSGQRRWQRAQNGVWDNPMGSPEPMLMDLAGPDLQRLHAISEHALHRFDDGAWTTLHTFAAEVSLRALVVEGDALFATGVRFATNDLSSTQGVLVRWKNGVATERLIPGVAQAEGLFFVDGVLWVVGVDGAIVQVVNP